MTKMYYFKFYPGDWLKDLELRVCSHFARGLLVDLLCAMFEGKHRGRLVRFDGVTPLSDVQVVSLSPGGTTEEKLDALRELLTNGVLKRDDTGVIYSARMVRDEGIRSVRAEAGSKGGSKRSSKTQANAQANLQAEGEQNHNYDYDYIQGTERALQEEGCGGEGTPEPTTEPEVNAPPALRRAASRFTPPTVAEVKAYCESRSNQVDASAFVDFYSSKGWKVGSNAMKDWQAAVRTWERNSRDPPPRPRQSTRLSAPSEIPF